MSYTIAPTITTERLGFEPLKHEPQEAFGPDYTVEDVHNPKISFLTCTVFGWQLDEEAALLMIGSLTAYLYDSQHHQKIKALSPPK